LATLFELSPVGYTTVIYSQREIIQIKTKNTRQNYKKMSNRDPTKITGHEISMLLPATKGYAK
jgi:hypothetical protein